MKKKQGNGCNCKDAACITCWNEPWHVERRKFLASVRSKMIKFNKDTTGDPALDSEIIRVIKGWRHEMARIHGEKVNRSFRFFLTNSQNKKFPIMENGKPMEIIAPNAVEALIRGLAKMKEIPKEDYILGFSVEVA